MPACQALTSPVEPVWKSNDAKTARLLCESTYMGPRSSPTRLVRSAFNSAGSSAPLTSVSGMLVATIFRKYIETTHVLRSDAAWAVARRSQARRCATSLVRIQTSGQPSQKYPNPLSMTSLRLVLNKTRLPGSMNQPRGQPTGACEYSSRSSGGIVNAC